MGPVSLPSAVHARWSADTRTFACCNTQFELDVQGWRTGRGLDRAERTARRLEARLDAFDPASSVAELDREGVVSDPHVATLVDRALAYSERTDGAFDVRHGALERRLKAYLRGDRDAPPASPDAADGPLASAEVRVSGDRVEADRSLDLNGLAKGYIVDRTREALTGPGRRGFVNVGGDIAAPTGPVGIESPYGEESPLVVLDTAWNVATSAGYRQRRGGVDHVYDPQTGHLGSRHDLVTVVAERDCLEADALATTLAALPLDAALALAEDWPGLAALVVHEGVFHRTGGFSDHVAAE